MRNSRWHLVERATVLTFTAASMIGCDGPTDARPSVPAKLVGVMPIDFSGVVGSEVSPGPVVRVVDSDGNPLSGVAIVFVNPDGGNGGLPVFTTVESDASGKARLATWKLGPKAGKQVMVARFDTLSPVTFRAVALTGPAAVIGAIGGDNQTGPSEFTLPAPVRVKVTDSFGNPIEEAEVTFSVQAGAGAVEPSQVYTNAAGEAGALWKLGVTGPNSVNASVPGLTAVTFTAVAGPPTPPFPATYELRTINYKHNVYADTLPSQFFLAADGTFTTYVHEIQGSGTYTVEGTIISLKYAPGFWDLMETQMAYYPGTKATSTADEVGTISHDTLTLDRCFTEECYDGTWVYARISP